MPLTLALMILNTGFLGYNTQKLNGCGRFDASLYRFKDYSCQIFVNSFSNLPSNKRF